MLTVRLRNAATQMGEVEVDAFLDSGASRSIFQGDLAPALGLDLLDGRPWRFQANNGSEVEARIHQLEIILSLEPGTPAAISARLDLALATSSIARNLLGHDFFDLVQVGFREHFLEFLLEPTP